MKKMLINKIKTLLEEQKTQILSKPAAVVDLDVDYDGDEVDLIQAKILALTATKLAARNKEKLASIDNALKRISDGVFGKCEECGDDIADKRLIAQPHCITCISCAEELEMLSKRGRI